MLQNSSFFFFSSYIYDCIFDIFKYFANGDSDWAQLLSSYSTCFTVMEDIKME